MTGMRGNVKRKKIIYLLLAVVGLPAAVIAGLCVKYSADAVLMASALAGDAVYARLFENTPEEDARYIEQAMERKDPALCGKVSARYVHSVMPRQTCYREVIMAVADPAVCADKDVAELIPEEECIPLVAAVTGDGTLCERSYENYAGYRDNCYYGLALGKNDPGSCRKISDPETKKHCLEQCSKKKKYDEDRASGIAPLIPG